MVIQPRLVRTHHIFHKIALSVIRTWDLSLCLYLNLKHDDLDRSATTAGYSQGYYS